jgi:hypothetical protein
VGFLCESASAERVDGKFPAGESGAEHGLDGVAFRLRLF